MNNSTNLNNNLQLFPFTLRNKIHKNTKNSQYHSGAEKQNYCKLM